MPWYLKFDEAHQGSSPRRKLVSRHPTILVRFSSEPIERARAMLPNIETDVNIAVFGPPTIATVLRFAILQGLHELEREYAGGIDAALALQDDHAVAAEHEAREWLRRHGGAGSRAKAGDRSLRKQRYAPGCHQISLRLAPQILDMAAGLVPVLAVDPDPWWDMKRVSRVGVLRLALALGLRELEHKYRPDVVGPPFLWDRQFHRWEHEDTADERQGLPDSDDSDARG